MSPIRVGLIGLSASAKTSWAAEGHLPYLLSERGREKYQIKALLNSSAAAAEAARKHFNLPSDVKAYGSAADLAADPDIDLVVVNTRVDVHASVAGPSVSAGKSVFIEWPLTEDLASAERLLNLYPSQSAAAHRSIIGLQGRIAPPVLKLKELLASGVIGKVLSSDIRAFANLTQRAAYPEGIAYFASRQVGGSPATIAYAHMIDFVHDVLGEWSGGPTSFSSHAQIQRPSISILGSDGKSTKTVTSDVPDLISVSGLLAPDTAADPGVAVAPGAVLTVSFRNGRAFPGNGDFVWTINGEKGEIRVCGLSGPFLHSDSYETPPVIELHDHASDEVRTVEWEWEGWQTQLPVRTRIVAQLYERFAKGFGGIKQEEEQGKVGEGEVKPEERWPTLLDALHRSREIGAVFDKWDAQVKA